MTVTKNQVAMLPMEFKDSQNRTIRAQMVNNQPFFIARDVCDLLKLTHTTNALANLDADEKLTVKIIQSGQFRNVRVVSESGLYNLIFRSNKPEAKIFRKWVTSVVLPAIRQTGGYEVQQPLPASAQKHCTSPYSYKTKRRCNMVSYKDGKLVIEITTNSPEIAHEDIMHAITFCVKHQMAVADLPHAATYSAGVLMELLEAMLPVKETVMYAAGVLA